MLPSWRDEVRIALSPDRVALARVSRRWRPKVVAKHTVCWSSVGTSDWHSCMEALQHVLQEPVWQDADARIVLSNHFVRYALVPWSEHLVSEEEKQAWVRHHFVELYGEPTVPTEYRWSEERPDAACVASAVDSELISGIHAAFKPTSLRLRSVQPYLMTLFNRWKRRFERVPLWIVLVETGRVCIAAIANGEWRTITSTRIGLDPQADLRAVLERRLLLVHDETPAAVYAYGSDVADVDLASADDAPPLEVLVPRTLPGYSPQSDADYSMALTGLV